MKNAEKKSEVFIVAGMLYGDEGKGTTVEYISKKYNCNFVVRFNGGPQAAHHIGFIQTFLTFFS